MRSQRGRQPIRSRFLGPHPAGRDTVVRAFVPPAEAVEAVDAGGKVLAQLGAVQAPGLFCGRIPAGTPYRLRIHWPGGLMQETEDPYCFGVLLGDLDLYLFAEGAHRELGCCLGAQVMIVDGIAGVRFAVWAPNARRGQRGRRLQRLGRPPPPDARASGAPASGSCSSRRWSRARVYKYEIIATGRRAAAAQGRPVGVRGRTAAGDRLASSRRAPTSWRDEAWIARRGAAATR